MENNKQIDIYLKNLSKYFGDIIAVQNLTLEVYKGEFLTLLGPSGSGKTTTLRMIGGFETPTEGEIYIQGKMATNIPPNKRFTRTVFQGLALFPHMTVGENIEYGLLFQGIGKKERRKKAQESLELVDLGGLYERQINTLSGGQKQRVALARALVTQPPILLLDEPLGALDEKLRERMQAELKNLHQRLGITFIAVTHNQEEALTMSDRIAIINRGRLEQVAAPKELYESPKTEFVADFIGVANIIRGEIIEPGEGIQRLSSRGMEISIPAGMQYSKGDNVLLVLRPELIEIGENAKGCSNSFSVEVDNILYKGACSELYIHFDNGQELRIRVESKDFRQEIFTSNKLRIGWNEKDTVVLKIE
jgi:spermidine/putrescine transport system ATP-binding protein